MVSFRKRMQRILVVSFVVILLAVLAYSVFLTYDSYAQMVVEQQQQHLLVTSRAIAQNLSLYLSEQLRDIDILTRTPGFLGQFKSYYDTGENRGLKEYILSYMISQHQGLSRIYLLDNAGNEIFRYNQYPFLEDFDEDVLGLDELSSRRQSGIGTVFPIGPHHYGMTLVNSIISGNSYVGTVVGIVDLEVLYKQYVAPLDVREIGYIMVKDQDGNVLMHPTQNMVSFNCFTDIPELTALPQYKSMRDMLQQQYEYEEGSAICRSYSNGIVPPDDEIISFSRMNLGGSSWFISAVMPYSDALQLVGSNLSRFGLLVSAILAVVASSIIAIYGLQKNRQKLQIETRYLKDINHTLEELHQSREQVRHYQKLQTIGSLASGIAHEFNNLLTPIMGYSEFLKEKLGPDNQYYDDIDEIFKAGARAKEIVEQILPFSRKETDSTSYGAVNLDAVILDSLKMMRMLLPSSIDIEQNLDTSGVNVFGSATQLNQILLNLCSNAYQAMEEKGGVLTIRSCRITPDLLPENFRPTSVSDYVMIEVSDTGYGMPPEVLSRIFDPFFTTKELGNGTGLGLSVVQNILISHGGFISAESTVDVGSSFFVYLPVTDLPITHSNTGAAAAPSHRQFSLLVVDDEVRVAKYLKKRLSHEGHTVEIYSDPEMALADFAYAPNSWDLLIVDYTMPKYKGTELAQRMKAINPALLVVLITGLVERDALEMQQTKIIDEIVAKPLDFAKLLSVVTRLLENHPNGTSD